jgi:hypothetical protein
MWFQRLVEIDDVSDPEPTPEPIERPPATIYNSVKIKKPKAVISTLADFQRVRLMSILRPKEQKGEGLLQKQTKARLTDDDRDLLEHEFKKNPKPTSQIKRQFAEDMGLDLARINVR